MSLCVPAIYSAITFRNVNLLTFPSYAAYLCLFCVGGVGTSRPLLTYLPPTGTCFRKPFN